jgi:hypothetical protein
VVPQHGTWEGDDSDLSRVDPRRGVKGDRGQVKQTASFRAAALALMTKSSDMLSDRNIGCNFRKDLIVPIKSRDVELSLPVLGIVTRGMMNLVSFKRTEYLACHASWSRSY